MTATEKYTETLVHALALSDSVARRAGYQEQVTEDQKLTLAMAFEAAVKEFAVVADELAGAIARAGAFIGAAGTVAARVTAIKDAIERGNTEAIKRARAEADRAWRNS
jgi:hypothetical protein